MRAIVSALDEPGPPCPLCGVPMFPIRAWADGGIIRYGCAEHLPDEVYIDSETT